MQLAQNTVVGNPAAPKNFSRTSNVPVAARLAQWQALQKSDSVQPFQNYTAFLAENPDWPCLTAIQLRAEAVMPDTLPDAEAIAFFSARPPLTPNGAIRYANALKAAGQDGAAKQAVHDFFLARDFGSDGAAKIIEAFPGWITSDDVAARVDKLIWEDKYQAVSDLLSSLPADARKVPMARLALLQQKKEADLLLNELSDSQQSDPTILFARARWRRILGSDSSAASLLGRIKTIPGHDEDVAKERSILSRHFFEQNEISDAFDVASAQPITTGQAATQNLWFAGWLALRFRQDVSEAAQYFQAFNDHVQTPVSRARGAYWLGRAAEAAGEADVAPQWYQVAAQYGLTFYGQLAAQKLGQAMTLPPRMSQSITDPILRDERLEAAQMLAHAGDPSSGHLFFRSVLNNAADEQQFAALANWANAHNQPHWAVLAGKAAQQHGFAGLRAAYPILAKNIRAEFDPRLDAALAHGLIRQESEFDVVARSGSGALGLMQLMPATAKTVAHKIGVHYSEAALTIYPSRNVQLGSHYIADQLNNFGNQPAAIAAYNAGPNRVKQWIASFGDPTKSNIDLVDWIESIPVYETRNYVQRVTENENVYKALLEAQIASQVK